MDKVQLRPSSPRAAGGSGFLGGKMNRFLQDLRFSIRLFVAKPGFTVPLVLLLGLSIAANVTLFTIINTILFRPLPFRHPEELVRVHETSASWQLAGVTHANFLDWKDNNRAFQSAAGFLRSGFTMTGQEDARIIFGFQVTAQFFDVLGVRAAFGRTFSPKEDGPGAERVVVLSHGFWQRLSGDPKLIGQTLTLRDEQYTIIGVMPKEFWFASRNTDVWVPLRFTPTDLNNRTRPSLAVIARLRPGVSTQRAETEMQVIASQLDQQNPTDIKNRGMRILPLADTFRPSYVSTLLIIQGAAAFVLLIACANTANLFLVGALARAKEFAVRVALGASRAQLIRQMLTESLVLSLLGGGLGLMLTSMSLGAVSSQLPESALSALPLADVEKIPIDIRVMAFAIGLSILTAIVFGLVPALNASRVNLHDALKESSGSSGVSRRRNMLGKLLVVGEVGISIVLLIGAGLLLKSFINLLQTDIGFNPDRILWTGIDLTARRYPDADRRLVFYRQLLQRVQAIPGVESVSLIDQALPIGGATNQGLIFTVADHSATAGYEQRALNFSVDANYFSTLRVPLLSGRQFESTDTRESTPVAIISQTLARRYWPNENPLGKNLRFGGAQSQEPWLTIIGIVGDVKNPLAAGPQPLVYRLYLQNQNPSGELIIRTSIEPKRVIPSVRREIRALDPGLPDIGAKTMDEALADVISQPRFSTRLLVFFASMALLLVTVGVYSVTHYWVTQRVREIGIRIALGAQRSDILKMVIGSCVKTALSGIGIGLLGALALTRLLSSQLYGVSTTDIPTFIGVSLFFICVSLLATFIPARRATKVDPMIALRND